MAQIIMPTRQAQERPEENGPSTLDKLLKGLQVAGGVLGIAADISALDRQSEQSQMAQAEEARRQQMAKMAQEKHTADIMGRTQQAEAQRDAFAIEIPKGNGETEVAWRVPSSQSEDPLERQMKEATLAEKQARTELAKAQAANPPTTTAQVRLMTEKRKTKEELEDDAKRHTKDIVNRDYLTLITPLNAVDKAIEASLKKDGDIAGYGQTGGLPTMVLTSEGKAVRSAVASLSNILLKTRSGAAVTTPEMRRFLEEVQSNPGMKDEDLIRGINMIRAGIANNIATLELGLEPDALALLKKQADERRKKGLHVPTIFSDDTVFAPRDFKEIEPSKLTPQRRDALISELKRLEAKQPTAGN